MAARTDGDDRTESTRNGRVVVGFDGSEASGAAVRWAAAEARRRDLTLKIITAFSPDYIFTTDDECRTYSEKVADQAVREAHEVAPGMAVEHQGYRDLPASALREESTRADLLVLGSRGRGGFSSLLLGSVSRQCVHRSLCPVVVVRPAERDGTTTTAGGQAAEPARPSERPESETLRIVVGVDGLPSSNAALLWAADTAESTGAELELIHTWAWLASAGWAVVPTDFEPQHDARTVLDRAIEPVRALHPNLVISAVIAEGQAAEVLTDASRGAQLLAVGSRGHGELSGLLLGSVSEYCVTHAHCPVLVIRGTPADASAGH